MEALDFTTAHLCIFSSTARKPVLALQVATGVVSGSIHAPLVPRIQKRRLKGGLDHAEAITYLSDYFIGSSRPLLQVVAPGTTPVLEPAWPKKGVWPLLPASRPGSRSSFFKPCPGGARRRRPCQGTRPGSFRSTPCDPGADNTSPLQVFHPVFKSQPLMPLPAHLSPLPS